VRTEVTREGRKLQFVEAQVVSDGEVVARARVVRMREAESPTIPAPLRYPPPQALEGARSFAANYHLSTVLETRMATPPAEGPTTAAMWARFGELAPDVPIDGLMQAAMLADLGSPLSQVADPAKFSFANVDLSLHYTRRPVGEWILLEARSLMQGQGVAVTDMVLADQDGEFGRAHQSLFIEPVAS
jgi:acyl-coenzyme A thioesterase PaaI-like protein